MKKLVVLLVIGCLSGISTASAQDKFFTKQGRILFNATGNMEKIEAASNTAICILDVKTGVLQLAVLLKGFEFEKALMQEHFNENYVESDKFPRAEFKGQILNNKEVVYTKDGTYEVSVKGILTLHGQSKEVSTKGKIKVAAGRIEPIADFGILLSDFGISIPGLVKDKISGHTKIQVDCLLEPLKN